MVLKLKSVLGIFFFLMLQIQAQTSYLNSYDNTRIAYTVQGEGVPILLLHGFIQNGKSWDKTELKKSLILRGYKVIVPDLRGNGDSDKPQSDKAYNNDAEVKDLMLLMDVLEIKNYIAIGYSRGSIVLAKLLTKDKRIKKAVLGGMGIDFTYPNWGRRLQFADAFNGKANEMTEGAVAYAKSIGADLRSLHLQQKFQPVTTVDELAELKLKLLVIAGDKDLDNGNPVELKNAIPKAVLKIIPGDHNGTYKTSVFSNKILDFLKD